MGETARKWGTRLCHASTSGLEKVSLLVLSEQGLVPAPGELACELGRQASRLLQNSSSPDVPSTDRIQALYVCAC